MSYGSNTSLSVPTNAAGGDEVQTGRPVSAAARPRIAYAVVAVTQDGSPQLGYVGDNLAFAQCCQDHADYSRGVSSVLLASRAGQRWMMIRVCVPSREGYGMPKMVGAAASHTLAELADAALQIWSSNMAARWEPSLTEECVP